MLGEKYKGFAHTADARFRMGEAQLLLGRTDDALGTLVALEKAEPKYPAMAEVRFNIGKALFEKRQYEEAVKRFEEVLKGSQTETVKRSSTWGRRTWRRGM